MTLIKKLSKSPCKFKKSFFVRGAFVKVTTKCQGKFKVCYKKGRPTEEPLTTRLPVAKCEKVELRSKKNDQVDSKTIRDKKGKKVEIVTIVLLKEFSKNICKEWKTFFFKGSKVTAINKCQGRFKVCYTGPEKGSTDSPLTTTSKPGGKCKEVTLESTKNDPIVKEKITDKKGRDVEVVSMDLIKEFSNNRCKFKKTFFIRKSSVKATDRCRGKFKVCYKKGPKSTSAPLTTTSKPGPGGKFKCTEINLKSTKKKAGKKVLKDKNGKKVEILGMTLLKQTSKTPCLEWKTFFYVKGVATAKKGCSGRFKVCYRKPKGGSGPGPAPSTPSQQPLTTTLQSGFKCITIPLLSGKNQPMEMKVKDNNGKKIKIVSMSVEKQLSKVKCKEWMNFFFKRSTITAKGGCGANFKVCYKVKPGPAPSPTPTSAFTTTPAPTRKPGKGNCIKMRIESKPSKQVKKTITDASNTRVKVLSVKLLRQTSAVECKEWDNYLYKGSAVIVKDGCGGTFKICFKPKPVKPDPMSTPPATPPQPPTNPPFPFP